MDARAEGERYRIYRTVEIVLRKSDVDERANTTESVRKPTGDSIAREINGRDGDGASVCDTACNSRPVTRTPFVTGNDPIT